jgi:hypothetical protein
MNPQENSEFLAALMRQEELLHLLVAAINKPKLGLHSERLFEKFLEVKNYAKRLTIIRIMAI